MERSLIKYLRIAKIVAAFLALLLANCTNVNIKDVKAIKDNKTNGSYLYGKAKFKYGGAFKIIFKNLETKEEEKYSKWWTVGPFTDPDRNILFSCPLKPGKWIIESILVRTGRVNGIYDEPALVNQEIEIESGKGNYLGLVIGEPDDNYYQFRIDNSAIHKNEIDSEMRMVVPSFNGESTTIIKIGNSGPFRAPSSQKQK